MTSPADSGSTTPPAAEFPFTDFQKQLEQVVERLSPPQVRNAARNAFVHLRRAWTLHPVDAEMSMFRAITAEEEAATAIILALKHRRYPSADRLNHWDHKHKSAVWAFVRAAASGMALKGVPTPQIHLRLVDQPRIDLTLDLTALLKLDQPISAQPDEPFNFLMRSDKGGAMAVHPFDDELQQLASEAGARDIQSYIDDEANLRNRLLYASNAGIPAVSFPDGVLIERAHRVTILLVIAIGVAQTPVHQLFVIQALESLVKALRRLRGPGHDFGEVEPAEGKMIKIEQKEDGWKVGVVERKRFRVAPWRLNHHTWPGTWVDESWPPQWRVWAAPRRAD